MGLIQTISLSKYANHKYLRFDSKYYRTIQNINFKDKAFLKDVFEIINGNSYTEYYVDEKTTKPFIRIGDLTFKDRINQENIIYLDDDFNIPQEKVLLENDLILATIGATIGKINLVREFNGGTFSNNTVVLRAKKKINYLFFEKLLQSDFYKNYIFGISSQKAQPNLQSYDLENIQVPNISLNAQNEIVKKIEPVEQEIHNLKSQKKEHLDIINKVFADEFNINLQKVFELDSIKSFSLKLQNVDSKNDLLRTSYKWHKLETIQSFMYEEIDCIEKLGKFITQTKNGWSPESSEIEDGIPVLGQEHILKKGIIDLNPTKYTTLTKSNIQHFFIKQNDFFVSRGNTIELVALAGVVLEKIEQDIIYPDLYIKIDFNNELINKQYMAFLFNSFIGRIYFKHVAKGKNQTMVKVSSRELLEFYLPLPELLKQQQIVEEIKSQIDAQKLIDQQIEQKQKEISDLIYQYVKDSY